jgi:hypothetical protein
MPGPVARREAGELTPTLYPECNDGMKHTDSFVVMTADRRQFTVHEMTEEGGVKRYELRDSPGKIGLLPEI